MAVIIISVVLTFLIAVFALLSLSGRLHWFGNTDEPVSAAASDRKIFREQMAELETQQKHGLLAGDSAEEAKLELARRILAAEKQIITEEEGQHPRSNGFKLFLSCAVLFIPLFCGAVYYMQGSPFLADRSFAAFMARNFSSLNDAEKIVRLEALTARNPRNGIYADNLAALYLKTGRFQDAANSYNRALVLNGENPDRLLGYALALTGFENGVVGEDAEAAFRKVLRIDPQNRQAQLFLVRGLLQSGEKQKAVALLKEFLLKTPLNSPWRKDLENVIAAVQASENPENQKEQHNKNRQQAEILTPAQRDFIIVNLPKLEMKLQKEPKNKEAWTMLLRAYILLGEQQKAEAVFARAEKILPPAEVQILSAALKAGLSLKPGAVPPPPHSGN